MPLWATPSTYIKTQESLYRSQKRNDKRVLGIQSHEEVLLTGMLWDKPVHDFRRDAR